MCLGMAYIQPRVFNVEFLSLKSNSKYKKSGLTETFSIEIKRNVN